METSTAVITLSEKGIVQVRIREGAKQGLDEAKINMAAAIAVREGLRRPLMTDIRFCHPLTPEARRYYSGQLLNDSFSALAMLIDTTPFGKMMGNVYLSIARPGIPTRLFTDEASAKDWLLSQ